MMRAYAVNDPKSSRLSHEKRTVHPSTVLYPRGGSRHGQRDFSFALHNADVWMTHGLFQHQFSMSEESNVQP
ncbi:MULTISPECIES: hypothetical protein [Methylomonas]|uniref:hypothetical protein n=1 Tax=Methylomonas TaxID=416 RepID=UPI000AC06849|nr:hypothetical protein [Methylomonas koyamae]